MAEIEIPKVTFGFVNAERLFYLKSCVETVYECTSDYENREFIVVDNASREEGTDEYLNSLRDRGFIIKKQEARAPNDEFAKALNFIAETATGDFIAPLQADTQFIMKHNWLKHYVSFYEQFKDNLGCVMFDAQRRVRLASANLSERLLKNDEFDFILDLTRNPVCGAADVLYSKEMIKLMYPWHIKNADHEGGQDSETAMLNKVKELIKQHNLKLYCAMPIRPVSAAIHTDARGTNARVRGNKRYGNYWEAKDETKTHYYNIWKQSEIEKNFPIKEFPYSIEDVVKTIGFEKPIDESGNWKKNPIKPKEATENDYITMYEPYWEEAKLEATQSFANDNQKQDEFIDNWLKT